MARVTVEDCIDKIPNRYELLMVASQRAKDISSGSSLTVPRDNDKNTVVALREIADETISIEDLQRSLVIGLQKYVEVEEPEEEELEILAAEKELSDLDDEFSGVLLESELAGEMQFTDSDGVELESGYEDTLINPEDGELEVDLESQHDMDDEAEFI